MKLAYIAGPYSAGDVGVNIRNAIAAGDQMWAKGYAPYIPHLNHLWQLISPKPYDEWIRIDIEILRRSDILVRLPGNSIGADDEVIFATHIGIPVYFGIEEVPDER